VLSPDQWSERFRRFAEAECRGLSRLYEVVSLAVAADAELLEWLSGVIGERAHPTLLFAAVHFLLLDSDTAGQRLAAFYPNLSTSAAPPEIAYPAFREFVWHARERLATLLATRVTQTNEVARCCYLLPAFVHAAKRTPKSLAIVDVGSSAGLTLLFDRYAYDYGDGSSVGDVSSSVRLTTTLRGGLIETKPVPRVVDRVGIDLAPIRLDDAAAVRWLEACVWSEHIERFTTLRAALALARIDPPRVIEGNAVDVLPALVAGIDSDAALVIVNTNVMLYFSRDEQARYARLLANIGATRELFWVANEHPRLLRAVGFDAPLDPSADPTGLPLAMTHFRAGRRRDDVLAWVGPHGRWLDWRA
jgi:hypothetical protein